jgi:hypothetical protein
MGRGGHLNTAPRSLWHDPRRGTTPRRSSVTSEPWSVLLAPRLPQRYVAAARGSSAGSRTGSGRNETPTMAGAARVTVSRDGTNYDRSAATPSYPLTRQAPRPGRRVPRDSRHRPSTIHPHRPRRPTSNMISTRVTSAGRSMRRSRISPHGGCAVHPPHPAGDLRETRYIAIPLGAAWRRIECTGTDG